LILVCLALVAAPMAFAQTEAQTPGQLAEVYRCADISESEARLACYDAAVGRLKQAEEAGDFRAIDREGVTEVRREAFGFALPNLARILPFGGDDDNDGQAEQALERQTFEIARVIERPYGYFAFVMTNGQVWAQVVAASARPMRPGAQVTIRRASLGSYMMVSERGGAAQRVRREQ
jgi:hypothetical protein